MQSAPTATLVQNAVDRSASLRCVAGRGRRRERHRRRRSRGSPGRAPSQQARSRAARASAPGSPPRRGASLEGRSARRPSRRAPAYWGAQVLRVLAQLRRRRASRAQPAAVPPAAHLRDSSDERHQAVHDRNRSRVVPQSGRHAVLAEPPAVEPERAAGAPAPASVNRRHPPAKLQAERAPPGSDLTCRIPAVHDPDHPQERLRRVPRRVPDDRLGRVEEASAGRDGPQGEVEVAVLGDRVVEAAERARRTHVARRGSPSRRCRSRPRACGPSSCPCRRASRPSGAWDDEADPPCGERLGRASSTAAIPASSQSGSGWQSASQKARIGARAARGGAVARGVRASGGPGEHAHPAVRGREASVEPSVEPSSPIRTSKRSRGSDCRSSAAEVLEMCRPIPDRHDDARCELGHVRHASPGCVPCL